MKKYEEKEVQYWKILLILLSKEVSKLIKVISDILQPSNRYWMELRGSFHINVTVLPGLIISISEHFVRFWGSSFSFIKEGQG